MGTIDWRVLALSLLITVFFYGLFPLLFAMLRTKPIKSSTYRIVSFVVNFFIMALFFFIAGSSTGGPYAFWTLVFTGLGVSILRKRGSLIEPPKKEKREIPDDERIGERRQHPQAAGNVSPSRGPSLETVLKTAYPACSYSEIFETYLNAGNDLLATFPLYTGDRFELMPFLSVIGYLSIQNSGGDSQKFFSDIEDYLSAKFQDSEWDYFDGRMKFYFDTADGGPAHGFWSLDNIPPSVLSIPMFRCAVAFGDCITNPDCIKDYEHAPILLSGIDEKRRFSSMFSDSFFRFVKTYCVAVVGRDFTPPILHNVDSDTPVRSDNHTSAVSQVPPYAPSASKGDGYSYFGKLLLFFLILGIVVFCIFSPHLFSGETASASVASPSPVVVRPSPEPSLTPRAVTSGRILKMPGYERVCPLSVSVPKGETNYYIYLEYLWSSTRSTVERKQIHNSTFSDLAFYVKAGDTVDVEVPIGVYKLYYACGSTWYGTKYLFGPDSSYFKSDDHLEFYADTQYYNGHTLELWPQSNGNLDTDPIPASQFPG